MEDGDAARTEWLANFAILVRSTYDRLPTQMQRSPIYWGIMQKPCQLMAFTVSPPGITKIFFLHLPDLPDLTIWAYGPLQPHELLNLFERIRKDKILQAEIPKDSAQRPFAPAPQTVAAFMERPMLEFLEQIRGKFFDPPGGGGLGSANYHPIYQEATLYEEYVNTSPKDLIRKWVDDEKELERIIDSFPKKSPTRSEIEDQIKAHDAAMDWSAVFFFPPIRIGPMPDSTLRERLAPGQNRFDIGKVAFTGKVASLDFIATFYGCIAVKTRDELRACEVLNMVSGAMHLAGIHSFGIRPRDLEHFQFDEASQSFAGTSVPGTERSVGNKDTALNKFGRPEAITVEQVEAALTMAEKYEKDPRLRSYLPLFLDSFGSMKNKEWDYSFYSSWLIVEMQITRDWEEAVKNGSITQKRYSELRSSSIADSKFSNLPKKDMTKIKTVGPMLAALDLIGQLSSEDFKTFDELRNRRNEILHPDKPANETDAKKCYDAAERIIRARIAAL